VTSATTHKQDSPETVRCYVLTVSDSRTDATDKSGDAVVELLQGAGHELTGRRIVKDDPAMLRGALKSQQNNTDVIITTGGTGITMRDSTFEAITALLDKHLDGFGELFRMLSYAEIGSAAMLSRACAGTLGRTAVFSLPGSEHAVRLAMTRLILPELGHVVRELRR
jgi:molybdenum cofactor biosynthesis protein B